MDKYHLKYSSSPDKEIQNRLQEKLTELKRIFKVVQLNTNDGIIKLAVLGCADRRLIKGHREIFEKVFKKPIDITTLDIVTTHLGKDAKIIKHDCTLPIPGGPYSITYAHVLLKFIQKDKQWNLILNSYNALKLGGLAIHILDKEDYQQDVVPLTKLINKLETSKIKYKKVPIKYGLALIIKK